MIKKIFLIAAISLSAVFSYGDPGDNWPWGYEMDFTWRGIEGTYIYQKEDNDPSYFLTVEVLRGAGRNNRLEISMRDEDCHLLAKGAGVRTGNVVHGALLEVKTNNQLEMTIHVFSDATMRKARGEEWDPVGKRLRSYTVLNLRKLGEESQPIIVQIKKIQKAGQFYCDKE